MSDMAPEDIQNTQRPLQRGVIIEQNVLQAARLPFLITLIALLSIVVIYCSQNILKISPIFKLNESDSSFARFLFQNSLYVLLTMLALFSSYIGYRLTVAAGATRIPVIPPEDYNLLSPLVRDGKTDAIDQYVRLSSLTKFTGTFTQLGLTGLPLATIFLTLFFSFMTIAKGDGFLDLTKLTLGAFIGSFVQRQIERRAETSNQGAPKDRLLEAVTPPNSA